MARKKGNKAKGKAPPKPVLSTPEKKKKEDKLKELDFQLAAIKKETKRQIEELTRQAEQMLAANAQEHEDFLQSVPPHLLNMKMCDLFAAGYKLDYSSCHQEGEPFVPIAPFDFEPELEEKRMKPPPKRNTRAARAPSTAQSIRSTRSNRLTNNLNPNPELAFTTPGPGNASQCIVPITPKVILQPKKGHKVFYSENGSPLMFDESTVAKARNKTAQL